MFVFFHHLFGIILHLNKEELMKKRLQVLYGK